MKDSIKNEKPVISLKGVNKWYGDFQALEKVSLNLRAGIITGLIGPSGCGGVV